jgi:hypothetical protein
MRYLYLDNFRGFKNTTIPILDVNFLVGENSTGKTSVLTMLRMLSNRSLIFGLQALVGVDSSAEGAQFGHFAEMVSAHSPDRSYFRLGMMSNGNSRRNKRSDPSAGGVLMTFHEFDGLPSMSQLTCTAGQHAVSIRIDDDHCSYKILDEPPVTEPEEMSDRLMKWADQHANPTEKGWAKVDMPKGMIAKQVPLFVILTMARTQGGGGKETGATDLGSIIPQIGPELIWIAPIRTKPLRTYDEPHTSFSPDGTHTPYVIRRMLGAETSAARFRKFIEKIGNASGLFEKIDIKYFNTEKTGPFEVDAFIDGEALSLGWLGYGVSQSLPIIVELIFRNPESCFAIQQPEVHLHPRAQASLGDAFFEMALLDRKTFLVETHSDFAIDRFRMNYRLRRPAKERAGLPASQILFFERRDKQNTVTSIPISQKGDISPDQPDNYRNFFIKEEIRLIGID